jgi:hypothetical protein
MLLGFATGRLTAKLAFNRLPAIADLLDSSLYSRLGPAGLFRLVADFVPARQLPASDPAFALGWSVSLVPSRFLLYSQPTRDRVVEFPRCTRL